MVKLALQADPTGFALTPRLKYWVPQNPFNRSQQQNVLLLQKASAYPKLSEILIGPMSISGGRTSLPTLVNALCPRLADLLVPRVGYRRSNSPDLGPVQSSLLPSYPCLSQKSKQPVPRRDPRRSIFWWGSATRPSSQHAWPICKDKDEATKDWATHVLLIDKLETMAWQRGR